MLITVPTLLLEWAGYPLCMPYGQVRCATTFQRQPGTGPILVEPNSMFVFKPNTVLSNNTSHARLTFTTRDCLNFVVMTLSQDVVKYDSVYFQSRV